MKGYNCKICGKEITQYEHVFQDGICFSCRKNRYYKDLEQSLKGNEQIETNYEDAIICPYCGNRIEDDDGYFQRQGEGEYECDNCEKTFNFEVNVEVTYSTSRQARKNEQD